MRAKVRAVVAVALWASMGAGCADDETTTTEPLVFDCDLLDMGQSLSGTATLTGSDLVVRIQSNNGTFSQAPTIDGVTSGTLGSVTVQDGVVNIEIADVTSTVSFSFSGRLTGPQGDFCDLDKTFTVTVNADGATVD